MKICVGYTLIFVKLAVDMEIISNVNFNFTIILLLLRTITFMYKYYFLDEFFNITLMSEISKDYSTFHSDLSIFIHFLLRFIIIYSNLVINITYSRKNTTTLIKRIILLFFKNIGVYKISKIISSTLSV